MTGKLTGDRVGKLAGKLISLPFVVAGEIQDAAEAALAEAGKALDKK